MASCRNSKGRFIKCRRGIKNKRTGRPRGLGSLDSVFLAEIEGELMTCEKYGKRQTKSGKEVVRCEAFGPGSRPSGPAEAPLALKRKAGIKSAQPRRYKECQVKSGPKKGKLKKGWRYNKRGECVRAAA